MRNSPTMFRTCTSMLHRTKGACLSGILSQNFQARPNRRAFFGLLDKVGRALEALRHPAREVPEPCQPLSLSFTAWAGANVSFLDAAICMAAPVAGLRPSRAGLSLI